MKEKTEIIILGDIIGQHALNASVNFLSKINDPSILQIKIANAENISQGFGLTEEDYKRLIKGGFDLLTSGNHIWDKKDIFHYIDKADKLIRPCNFPSNAPGKGWRIIEREGVKIAVINVLCRVYMHMNLDCPFRACDKALEEIKEYNPDIIIVDVHGEATSEKVSIAYYLDGRVSAVVGTHTHVQTADERILNKGTAYITDIGACCAFDSIIGMTLESSLPKFLMGIPYKSVISQKEIKINGAKILFDNNLKCTNIERISE